VECTFGDSEDTLESALIMASYYVTSMFATRILRLAVAYITFCSI